jgi:phospholipid/cholesterol/gamma-HCH transport system substrate-binding protein
MKKNVMETLMGAVVLIVAGLFLFTAYKSGELRVGSGGYHITGRFSNASGIGLGSDVRVGGIKVGVVSDLSLDPKTYEALVTMQISQETKLPKDSSAAVTSSGLMGEKFIQITPGGDDAMLADGGKLSFTQSSVNLEEMIGKFMFSGGGVDSKSGDKDKKSVQ